MHLRVSHRACVVWLAMASTNDWGSSPQHLSVFAFTFDLNSRHMPMHPCQSPQFLTLLWSVESAAEQRHPWKQDRHGGICDNLQSIFLRRSLQSVIHTRVPSVIFNPSFSVSNFHNGDIHQSSWNV